MPTPQGLRPRRDTRPLILRATDLPQTIEENCTAGAPALCRSAHRTLTNAYPHVVRSEQHAGGWLYYPVVVATKTPMPFLLFAGAGLAGLLRYPRARGWQWFAGLVLAALSILLASLASPINMWRTPRRSRLGGVRTRTADETDSAA